MIERLYDYEDIAPASCNLDFYNTEYLIGGEDDNIIRRVYMRGNHADTSFIYLNHYSNRFRPIFDKESIVYVYQKYCEKDARKSLEKLLNLLLPIDYQLKCIDDIMDRIFMTLDDFVKYYERCYKDYFIPGEANLLSL